ncbi:HAD family hydrolase [Gordonia liuliyuniae]|uniref:HAD family hydrolase n=1 Tax=Gordonia liuliyuniae TaxID=2911517 RepID=A0ABS9ITW2_9ACTN|nr:HAD family hydrolase [Gordonia liuliyuniae]MCF8588994.1 HAD family hydrolase [Gordonia liuliyuniae]
MNALIATDLDRTMIYSESALAAPPGPDSVCVEIYRDAPLSFMTQSGVDALTALAARTPVVPVTTRTRAQFERIMLPGRPFRFAVVSNGGRILCDGEDDVGWRAALQARVRDRSVPLADLHADLLTRIDESWVRATRVADDLFAYLVVDTERQPADFLASWNEWCVPRGWTVSQQGRKIYAMPVGVTKSAAIAEVRRRLVDDGALSADAPVLAAGDGRLDADMLESADHAIRPRHGELHDSGWTIPGLAVTRRAGIAAGEEILAWFAAHTPDSPTPDHTALDIPVPDPAFAEK